MHNNTSLYMFYVCLLLPSLALYMSVWVLYMYSRCNVCVLSMSNCPCPHLKSSLCLICMGIVKNVISILCMTSACKEIDNKAYLT